MKIIKKKIIINLIIILSLFGFNTLSNSMENKNMTLCEHFKDIPTKKNKKSIIQYTPLLFVLSSK